MMNILVDTCFWYALYDPRDKWYKQALTIREHLQYNNILIPYPVLYETLNTRFVKQSQWLLDFQNYLTDPSKLIADEKYKLKALKTVLSTYRSRPISLVDTIIRLMMDDINLNIKALITFNAGDFADICHSKGIELIYNI